MTKKSIQQGTWLARLGEGACLLIMLRIYPLAVAQSQFGYDLHGNLGNQVGISLPGPIALAVPSHYELVGSNQVLAVTVPIFRGSGIDYQWLLDGIPITGATNDSYEVTGATIANLGNYQLVVSNTAGVVTSAVIVASFDSDHSGLPDAWQTSYFGHLRVDPFGDADGDGVSNLDEFLDGTDPTDPNSYKPRLTVNSTFGGNVSINPFNTKYNVNDAVQLQAVPAPGMAFFGWYGGLTGTNPAASLLMNGNKNVTALFGVPLDVALDTTNVVWTSGGDMPWFGQTTSTFDGVSAGRSGIIGINQQSWLQTSISATGFVKIAFEWSVSSQTNHHYLSLFTNQVLAAQISGEEPWQAVSVMLPPGSNGLQWAYSKDNWADHGYDRAWVDQVQIIPMSSLALSDATCVLGDPGSTSAVFTVSLNRQDDSTVRVGYATADGTAVHGLDYGATNGMLVFGSGVTNQAIIVPIIQNNYLPTSRTFNVLVSASSPNALVSRGQALGTIVNGSASAGHVNHFTWSAINPAQRSGAPFAADIAAQDSSNNLASGFVGEVRLDWYSGARTNILGGIPANSDGEPGKIAGYSFTPRQNLLVTHVRHYFGVKVGLWTDQGDLIASQDVVGARGSWHETALNLPVKLQAGSTYRIGAYVGDSESLAFYVDTGPTNFANGAIGHGYFGSEFPNTFDSQAFYLVDMAYQVEGDASAMGSLAVEPEVSASFTNGVWSGGLAVTGAGTNIILSATDAAGHFGVSHPFNLGDSNNVALFVSATSTAVAVLSNLTINFEVINRGPSQATAVRITNALPPSVAWVSGLSSQGSWSRSANLAVLDLGTLTAGQTVTASLVVLPMVAGVNLTNVAVITRSEIDSNPADNFATNIVAVQPPSVTVVGTSVAIATGQRTNLVFSVNLNAPSAQTVSIGFTTSDGSATANADYTPTNGVLTFPPGSTNQTAIVQATGDLGLNVQRVFYLNLAPVTNAAFTPTQVAGTLINVDQFPGFVHQFVWSPIQSPQASGTPFAVTITAQDVSNTVATRFSGSVSLGYDSLATGNILGDISPSQTYVFDCPAGFSVGYAFTPSQDIVVTHVRYYFGQQICIWQEDGTLLVNQSVDPTPGFWRETPLAAPLALASGQNYRLAAFAECGYLGYRSDGAQTFANGTINQGLASYDDSGAWDASSYSPGWFPSTPDSTRWWLVDITYQASGSASAGLALTPASGLVFTNGVWSGLLTLSGTGTNLTLWAADVDGHRGAVSLSRLLPANDLLLTASASPNPVYPLSNLTYSVEVMNPGPNPATKVRVTNSLPAGLELVSALASQGVCSTNGTMVVADMGTLGRGQTATLTIMGIPTVAGVVLTNIATVSRGEPDTDPANNQATSMVTVASNPPRIIISDAAVVQNGFGMTNLVFTVTLIPANAATVTVEYSTTNGTATAGIDYATSIGLLSFSPGETNEVVSVPVMGGTETGSNLTLYVWLSNPTNANLGREQAVGTIIKDGGLADRVHHFVWSPIGSPQRSDIPFEVGIAAKTIDDRVASGFTNSVAVKVFSGIPNEILGDVHDTAGIATFASEADTVGYSFTPNRDLLVRSVRHYFGSIVSIWTDDGVLLAIQPVQSVIQTWLETPLNTPVILHGGQTYRVGVYDDVGLDGFPGDLLLVASFYRTDGPSSFNDGVIERGFSTPGAGFPNVLDPARWYLVDMVYQPLFDWRHTPNRSGNFVDGTWSGTLTITATGSNLVAIAVDDDGNKGISNPFDLVVPIGLPSITSQPQPVSAYPGTAVTFEVVATGSGPMYYQWQFNGVNIAAATNSTLILSNVQVANAGIYEVLVSNDSGTIPSTEASLGLLSTVIAWGDNRAGQTNVPMGLVDVQAIGTGGAHTLALMADGGVTAWGANGYGQTDLPPGLSNAVAVAAGDSHSMALKSDGTIVCWGNNNWGQTTVPLGLSNVLAIACGAFHNLALQPNGAVMGWGNDTDGQIDIPTGVSDIVAISGGYAHSLALRQDGTVFAWGYGEDGETVVPNGLGPVKGISAGWYHNLALRNDGTVAAWGDNSFGQINVPVGLSNVVAVAAGGYHSLALRNDGNVVVWGTNSYGQATVPPTATNAMALAGGCNHSVALVSVGSNGWPRILRQPINVSANVGMMATFSIAASGALPLNYQWRLNGDNLPGATAVILALTNLQTTDGGGYDVVVSNGVGSATSDVAVLIVDRLEILAQPSDRWAFPGGSVTFSVGAVSAGILRFQWEKDGTAISGATNADLTIANVQATDAGIFRVAVRDAFRSLESAGASLRVTGTPIIVSSSADAGPGTLRTAINQANAQMGMDAIVFNIQSAGVQSIAPATPLPAIIDALVIDGYTQPGATSGKLASPNVPTLLIQLTGTNTVTICSGLDIMASNCVIRGLIVNGFGASGLTMRNSASGCRIQGNYIGVDATGTIRSSNGLEGVYSFGPGNLIGGKGPGEGNVISGNALSGVRIDASANQVLGNFIGTDITGTNALGNLSDGVTLSDSGQNSIIGGANAGSGNLISGNGANGVSIWSGSSGNVVQGNLVGVDVSGLRALQNTNSGVSLECPSNLVGGATVVARNILSGNGLGGIQLNGLECSNNVIQGNYIGADISGTKTVGNGEEGILLWAGPGNVIGGRGPGEGNIIAGNHGIGIRVYLGAQWTRIQGNSVGTDIMGAMNLGNWGPGIYIADAEHSVVGGTAPGEGNRVYHNGGAGIRIGPGTNNAMRANSIFGNGALGIDLGGDGVTANHVGGPIRGANEYQNYPVLMSAVNGTNIAIEGTLNSAAGTAYQLDFFGNDAPDASGYGQGQVYIGSVAVTTDGSGSASFTFSPTRVIPPGHWITATATDPWGNTSEFCAAVPVGSSLDILVQPASQVVSPGASAIFSVNARGVRPLTYQWQKDGVVLSGATNASLTITNIQANDAGTYWVVVSDASGSVTSTPAILSVAAAPVAIVVTNSADSGPGSLREAINAANNTLGSVQITFRIAGAGVRTIAPQTPLPALTTPIEIDGYSQPGAAPGQLASTNLPILLIQLTGTNTVTVCDGLDIMTSNCVIRGLVVNSFGGVGVGLLSGAAGSRIEGNYIGTDAGGGLAIGNHGGGVTVGGGAQSSIGGTVVGSGNLISGNGADGISVWSGSSSNVFQGNLIGVDATGLRGLKNTYSGISFRCAGNIVGGEAAGARNILSGNGFGGIQLNGVECSNNVIQGNFIGADITGTNAVGNGEEGILLWAGSDNVIGGSAPGEGNVILGNNGSGIRVYLGAQQTTIEGNSVGTDLTGTINLGNRGPGIEIDDAYDSVIGGAAPGEGNRVWYNTGAGIRIGPGTNNAVRANSIFGNGALGIDLGGDGVTPNHVGGSVPGGNQYQNYPVLAKAINASVTTIYGTLNSATNTAYQLDFFSSDAPDPSGYGQGQVYLGSIAVATDGSGNASFTFSSLSMIPLGRWITSTATDPFGNTSEFCQAVQVVSSLAILIEPRSQFVSPGASVTFSVSALGVGSLTYQWQKDGVALSGATNVSLTVTNIQANDAGAYRVVVSDASASVTSTPAILSVAAAPVAIIVTNAADSGPGSLREAINAANNTLGSVQITFRIAGAGVKTIAPQAPLPALTTPIEIDGYSQPGASPGQLGSTNLPTLLIQLTGTNTVAVCDGLDIMTSNCVLRGLVVNGFGQAGVGLLSGAMGSRIEGNYIGTGPGGGLAIGNRGDGVVLSSGTQNSIVGGTDAGAGNLVSGNGGNGIAIWGGSTENLIQGNLIGSDVSGRTALTNAYSGVALAGSGNTVGGLSAAARNLISGNAWSGVRIDAAMNQVLGNYIGTDITGTNALGNLSDGVTISGGSQNSRIGGTIAGSGNLISGNGANGVSAWSGSSGNIVQGNLVGVDVSGLRALKNTNSGVSLECASNVVGGEAAGARNILSGNGLGGIQLNGLECSNNVIQGNFIGADITGTNAVGNGEEGILLWAGIGNVIGGSGAGQGNVIVGNHGNGLVVYLNARGTRFMGNSVGTDLSGTVPMGNLGPGLTVADAHESLIGGTAAGEGNRLAYNGGAGIAIGPGTNNAVRGNSIFANGALGIDLGEDGVTPNHVGGPIPGANQYQNYPVLTSVLIGTNTAVQGTLNSAANSTYQLDFFSNDVPDPSGYGEGQTYLGSSAVTTDGNGNAAFTFNPATSVSLGNWVTATATDPVGNTSEFSQAVQVSSLQPVITQQPTNQTIFSGGMATFSVSVKGVPPFSYQWRLNGTDLTGAFGSILLVTNAQISDAGAYSVIMSNGFGWVVSSNAWLTVNNAKPFFQASPASQATYPGGTAIFQARVDGSRPFSYQWYRDSSPIAGATNSALVVSNAIANQGGITLVASNQFGSVTSDSAGITLVTVAAWGLNDYGQGTMTPDLTNVVAVSCGFNHSLVLRQDGTVKAWGRDLEGQCDPPPGLTNVAAISAGAYFSLALKKDGTVVGWGDNQYGQLNGIGALTAIQSLSAGLYHCVAVRSNGTVVAWGRDDFGQVDVPSGLTNIISVSGGYRHSLALRANGTVVAWGSDLYGACDVPVGLSNVVAIVAGRTTSLALRSDGTLQGWSTDLVEEMNIPLGLSNVVAVEGYNCIVAIKNDGTLVAWGYDAYAQTNVPVNLRDVISATSKSYFCLALVRLPGTLILSRPSVVGGRFLCMVVTEKGKSYTLEYKNSLSQPTWTPVITISGDGTQKTLTDASASGKQRFYRVEEW